LNRNEFDLICRSHQVVEEGYEFSFGRKIITIFSAPNYCGEFMNLGAMVKVGADMTCKLEQFEGQPIAIKARARSDTPIRMLSGKENNSPLKEKADDSDVKKRKATKVFKGMVRSNHSRSEESQG
jgi:hypothetical protein